LQPSVVENYDRRHVRDHAMRLGIDLIAHKRPSATNREMRPVDRTDFPLNVELSKE
jgi:hypothetical protein